MGKFMKVVGVGVVGIAGIVIVSSATGGGEDTSSTTTTTKPADKGGEVSKTVGVGDKVRDGKFEFTVQGTATKTTVGPKFLEEDAQGKFLLVKVKVENIGDEAQYLSGTDQYLYDKAGKKYSADDGVMSVMEGNPFLEQINPGNTVQGTIPFDIPTSVKPVKMELHDSMFSGGVEVTL